MKSEKIKNVYLEITSSEILSYIGFLLCFIMIFINFKWMFLIIVTLNFIFETRYYLNKYVKNHITFKKLVIKNILLIMILLIIFILIFLVIPDFNIFDVPKLVDNR